MSMPPQYATGPATPARLRPNVLFLLPGLLLIIAGVGTMLLGLLYLVQAVQEISHAGLRLSDLGAGPHARRDMEPMVNGFAVFIIGCTVMTVGRYLWRGARRRGWRDRLGRCLIIVGYLVVGTALYVLTRFILAAMSVGDAEESGQIMLRGLLTCAAVAIPGALLALPGFRLAREKPLMKAKVNADL